MERPLTLVDAATALSTSPSTLRLWVRTGQVPHLRLGRRLMFLPSDLERVIEKSRVGRAAEDGGAAEAGNPPGTPATVRAT